MPWLADTGVLLRMSQPSSLDRTVVQEALERLIADGESMYVSTQNIIGFRNVATRPAEARSGLGMSPSEADMEIVELETVFEVAYDFAAVYEEWKRLVSAHAVQGRNVHDARIAAV